MVAHKQMIVMNAVLLLRDKLAIVNVILAIKETKMMMMMIMMIKLMKILRNKDLGIKNNKKNKMQVIIIVMLDYLEKKLKIKMNVMMIKY